MHKMKQTVFKLFFPKSIGIPPSLRYGASFPLCRHAVARRAKVVSGTSRRIPQRENLTSALALGISG
jgi:hypothetical protein